nr:AlNc14C60G4415 [Albugo laibachii Nc14]|eukprot:CCA18954.1 AlNc14C60G4415 [Albugo laibachii Nc14]
MVCYLGTPTILATRAGEGVGEGLDKRNDSVLTAVIGRNSVVAIVRRVKMCNCVLFPSCRPSSTIRWMTIVVFFYVICTSVVGVIMVLNDSQKVIKNVLLLTSRANLLLSPQCVLHHSSQEQAVDINK